jgi:selenocysteine lyase/cysteine desulfurase
VGVWPQVTVEAVKAFAEENALTGSLNYPHWMKVEKKLRGQLAELINAASVEEIALVKNTSEGLSFVAYGLPWQAGENVVGIQQEFPSNRFVWESLSNKGIEFRKLDMHSTQDPEQSLFDLCDANTRLISISAVQYHNGFRMDLEKIGDFCRQHKILFCVDAIQQLGSLEFDVQSIGADFVIADGHKWLLSAEGLGVFYVRRAVIDQLQVLQYGWHMVEQLADYTAEGFELASGARRFECGSPNMLGIHALQASLDLLLSTGMQNIQLQVLDNSRYLIQGLSAIQGIRVMTDASEERLSGIVTFQSDKPAAQQMYRLLMEQGILCAARGGGVRLSPHFYTPRDQLEQTLRLIEDLVKSESDQNTD